MMVVLIPRTSNLSKTRQAILAMLSARAEGAEFFPLLLTFHVILDTNQTASLHSQPCSPRLRTFKTCQSTRPELVGLLRNHSFSQKTLCLGFSSPGAQDLSARLL